MTQQSCRLLRHVRQVCTPDDRLGTEHVFDNQYSTADFCLIPIGTPEASVSKEIAAVQRLLKKTRVKYSMHSAGTTLGSFRLAY